MWKSEFIVLSGSQISVIIQPRAPKKAVGYPRVGNKANYPKMLYKAEASRPDADGFLQNNERIGYKTVQSAAEEARNNKVGWVNHPQAIQKLARIDRNRRIKQFLIDNWKTWLSSVLTIAALYVAYLGLK